MPGTDQSWEGEKYRLGWSRVLGVFCESIVCARWEWEYAGHRDDAPSACRRRAMVTVREPLGRIIALLFANVRYLVFVWYKDVSMGVGG